MSWLATNPEITALLIVTGGYFASRWLSHLLVELLRWFDRRIADLIPGRQPHQIGTRSGAFIRHSVFYLLFSLFILAAIRVLGFIELSSLLDELLVYVPQLLLGLVIIFVGYLLSLATRNLVASLPGIDESSVVLPLTQGMIMLVAILTGLAQMQINVTFLGGLVLVIIAAFLLGLAIAFALGARILVANLLASRDLTRFNVGDRIEIEGRQGQIREIHQTGIVLQTEQGLAHVPAGYFSEKIVILLDPATEN